MTSTRRDLINRLAAAGGILAAAPVLTATEPSGDLAPYARFFADDPPKPPPALVPTEANTAGPYFRPGALFRAKVCPPRAAGTVLLISGRILSTDGSALGGAMLEIWHADDKGRYDNDDPDKPPGAVMINRARLVADERGRYEYETILPAAYRTGPKSWRPRHIHYRVRAARHGELITQLYFKGEEHNDTDTIIRPALIIALSNATGDAGAYKQGVFDVVLAKAQG